MDGLWQDLRYAVRRLRRDIGFTAMIVFTLAIGIGVNTAVFSVVRSVLFAPLPYEDPDRLTMVWTAIAGQGVQDATSAYANVQDWKAQNRVFDDLAWFDPTTLTLTGGTWPERISGVAASANLFSVLGVAPVIGRAFSQEDERQRAPLVVVSHGVWQRRFGSSPDAIGQRMEIGGATYHVIGVMPDGFWFPDKGTQLWMPQTALPGFDDNTAQRGAGSWNVVGRRRAGVPIERVRQEMNLIATRLEQSHPAANAGLRVNAVALQDHVTGSSFRLALWTLFGAVGLVLVIACANGAHMILVRGMNRAQEVAVRVALGASASRLVRQALTESVILSAVAGIAGVLLAVAALRLLVSVAPGNIPRLDEIRVDTVVLFYATTVSLVVGVVFGIAPAVGLARGPLSDTLREGRSAAPSTRGHAARRLLIVVQFALAIILVFGANLLIRSLLEVRRVDPGFRAQDVLMASLSVESPARRAPFYEQVVREVAEMPGVVSAGIVEDLFVSGAPNRPITVEGRASGETPFAPLRIDAIAGDLFGTLGVPLREGRGFSTDDRADAVPVAIVNRSVSERFWPGQSPIGKRFRIGDAQSNAPWLEVVGVVGDMQRQGPEKAPLLQVFLPYVQAPSRNMILLLRTEKPMPGLMDAIRTRIAAIDGAVPVYGVTTVTQALDGFLEQRRFQTVLLGLFSAIALILSAVGIYGLIQYSVAQRTHEIGIRIALGGSSGRVIAMILRQGLSVSLPGVAAGMVCALLLSAALSTLFFGVTPSDPASIVITAGILLVTTLAACYIPARRAARVDPMIALRSR